MDINKLNMKITPEQLQNLAPLHNNGFGNILSQQNKDFNKIINTIKKTKKEKEEKEEKWRNDMLEATKNTTAKEDGYKKYDVFLSHATADKTDYVLPLYDEIRKLGINIFYDTDSIDWGDTLKTTIEKGLSNCEFGIIVISPNFLGREWTEKELTDLLERENETGQKVILPILHSMSIDDLKATYPEVAEKRILESSRFSHEKIIIQLAKVLIKRYKGYV